MGSTDILDLFVGYSGTTPVFHVQMQKSGSTYQARTGAWNGSASVDSAWYNLATGWNGIEIQFLPGYLTGQLSLWVGGTLKQTLNTLNNNGYNVDSVRLGAMGVDTGTRGTVFFDDFDSHRDSYIGLLADPGVHNQTPTPAPGMTNKSYSYGNSTHVHAVTALSTGEAYSYDANGNMTCRVENGMIYNQVYNAENRLATVQQLGQGNCPAADTLATASIAATWNFIYDGDGNRVQQEYFEGAFGQNITVKGTDYFAGGSYELEQSGVVQADLTIQVAATTTLKYYSFAGQLVAMTSSATSNNPCATLCYFLSDQLGSVMALLDTSGNIAKDGNNNPMVQRYLPFGQVRTDIDTISQTDLGYTGQRNLDAQTTASHWG